MNFVLQMYLILGSFHFLLAPNISGSKYTSWVNKQAGTYVLSKPLQSGEDAVHMLQEAK